MTKQNLNISKIGINYIGITTPFYCNDGLGNFVMHKRSLNTRDENGKWDFGSGKLDFGEELEVSVLRELDEEYGVKGVIQEQIPPHSIIRNENGIKSHWLAIPFFIKIDINKARIMEPLKASNIGIFRLDKLPKPLHKGVQITMKKYPNYFNKYMK